MKARKLAITLAFCLLLCSCADIPANVGDETTNPLEILLVSVENQDVSGYLNAFPPAYIAAVTDEYAKTDESLFEIVKTALAQTAEANGNTSYRYKLESKEKTDENGLAAMSYVDYHAPYYELEAASVQEAYISEITVTSYMGEAQNPQNARFTFLKIDGEWYLHPAFFLYMPS